MVNKLRDYILTTTSLVGVSSGILANCARERNTARIVCGSEPRNSYRVLDLPYLDFNVGSHVKPCCGAGGNDLVLADRGRCPFAYNLQGSDSEGRHAIFVCGRLFPQEDAEDFNINPIGSALSPEKKSFYRDLMMGRKKVGDFGIIQTEKEECKKEEDGFPCFCPLKKAYSK